MLCARSKRSATFTLPMRHRAFEALINCHPSSLRAELLRECLMLRVRQVFAGFRADLEHPHGGPG